MADDLQKECDDRPIRRCPRCGSKDVVRQKNGLGRMELLCLAPDCDFREAIPSPSGQADSPGAGFADNIVGKDEAHLSELRDKLKQSIRSLTGRAARLARRQLQIVELELAKRATTTPSQTPADCPDAEAAAKAPPQLLSPQATTKRVQAIRKYYRRRKGESRERNLMLPGTGSARLFDTLLKTLTDEAGRHEQEAHNYARTPDLSPLHINYTARASELRRVIDLLNNFRSSLSEECA